MVRTKVYSLCFTKSQFQRDSEGENKKLPIKSGEESFAIDYTIEPCARRSQPSVQRS